MTACIELSKTISVLTSPEVDVAIMLVIMAKGTSTFRVSSPFLSTLFLNVLDSCIRPPSYLLIIPNVIPLRQERLV